MRKHLFLIALFFILAIPLLAQSSVKNDVKDHPVVAVAMDQDVALELGEMFINAVKSGDQSELKLSLSDKVYLSQTNEYVSRDRAVYILNNIILKPDADTRVKVAGLDKEKNEWSLYFFDKNELILVANMDGNTTLFTGFTIPYR